jgi:6-phosphogluconolactonase (cycloisomerase 2 family)
MTTYLSAALPRMARRLAAHLMWVSLLLGPVLFAQPNVAAAAGDGPGAVFVISNAAGGNAVVAYQRKADGGLTPAGSYSTGGLGTGSGLGSQGALVVSQNGRWLLAVNAGSDDISVFALGPGGPRLTDVEPSGGDRPISVTLSGHLVYVLNAGGSGNIAGFALSPRGRLTPLPGSIQPLSNGGAGASTDPAQISFSPDGQTLVVTEKATNRIVTYGVRRGIASGPSVFASAGQTPFGFAFSHRNTLIVSEAFGGAADASAASSYHLAGGSLAVVTPSAPTTETAACWVAVSRNGRYAYTTNAGSGSVSGYAVGAGGRLTLLDDDGQTGITGPGSGPIDAAFSRNGNFLYVVAGGTDQIVIFAAGSDGSLTNLGGVSIPATALGLAAF